MEDVEMVRATREGSASAFAATFDRHAAAVHDLALTMLGNRAQAHEVLVATFHEARRRLHGLANAHRLGVWLLAVARDQAALRAGATGPEGYRPEFPDDPGRGHLTGLVWEAVAGLPLPERTHLDLKLRHGLDGGDLASALGVTARHAEDLDRRLKELGNDLSSYLAARTNADACPGLATLLPGWDGRLGAPGLSQITSHVKKCRTCAAASASLPSPLTLYGAIPMAPCPTAARARALQPPEVPDGPGGGDHGARPATSSRAPSRRPSSSSTTPGGPHPVLLLKVLPERPPVADAAPDTAGPSRPAAPTSGPSHPASTGEVEPPRPRPWLPDGFPPPSFPAPQGTGTGDRAAGRRRSRRLLPVAAVLGAALLLTGALLVAGGDDQRTALRSGPTSTSTTVEATTQPPTTLAPLVPLVPEEPAVTPTAVPSTAATTVAAAPTTGPPPATSGGELFPALEMLGLPTVDSTAGTRTAVLPLRNRGRAPLTYSTRSSFAGLTVDKPTGTILPGATVQLNVTLDGTKATEGTFTGMLTFDGSGGTKQVTVASVVGRPPIIRDDAGESCTTGAGPCSRLLQLVPEADGDRSPTLCNTPWRYSVTVEDESRLKAVTADADIAGRDATLRKDGATSGTGGRWQSDVFPPLPAGAVLSVTVNAVDEFDFGRFRTDSRIEC